MAWTVFKKFTGTISRLKARFRMAMITSVGAISRGQRSVQL